MKHFAWFLTCITASIAALHAESVPVQLHADGTFLRGGKPYFIKGAGGDKNLPSMVAAGANSFRTWVQNDLAALLPEAQKLGLTVSAGIWLEPECNWFSYGNPEHCERQFKRVRDVVLQFKDSPALLAWGLGNEIEGDGKNVALWKQINRLAEMVHREDPAHPAFIALAGMSEDKAANLNEHAPKLDFAGINTYGALPNLRETLAKQKWTRPFAVTEFGANGFWERPKTAWDAPVEQTSNEKAIAVRKAYEKAIRPAGQCIGSYVFIWGHKQEATSTWFGAFTKNGEATPLVETMQELWTGKPPGNRAPVVTSLKSETKNNILSAGASLKAKVEASDPDGDALSYRWEITKEKAARNEIGHELPAEVLPIKPKLENGNSVELIMPDKAGEYRVFVYVLDGKGHAGTANFPIQVK